MKVIVHLINKILQTLNLVWQDGHWIQNSEDSFLLVMCNVLRLIELDILIKI